MIIAPIPPHEARRLAALKSVDVLDSAPDEQFDALVRAASIVCGTPISLVTLVDSERQWFKANLGLTGVSETHRDVAFCAHAILTDDLFEVPDAREDERFADNPLVAGDPNIRFYAGMPLVSDGFRLGTLCVIDRQPRLLSDSQREVLRCLASAASRSLEDRKIIHLQKIKDTLHNPIQTDDKQSRFIRSAWFVNAIANATSDLIAYWGSDLRCRFANRAYSDWFGVPSGDIVGMHLKDLLGEELFRINEERISGALQGREQHFENELQRSAESISHVLVKYVPHIDEKANVAGFYVNVIDVSALKRTNVELKASEARFRTLSESSTHGVFHCATEGTCYYTNQRFQEIFGLSAEASLGRGWEKTIHPDDLQDVLGRWQAADIQPDEFDIEFRIVHSIQGIRRVRVQARPVAHVGTAISFVGSAEDVTEREIIRARLTESEARFRLLADASSDMIQRLGVDGIRRYVSPAASKIFGLDPGQLVGTHPVDYIHADDSVRVGRLIADLALGHRDQARSIHRIRHRDAHWVWVEVQFSLVRDKATAIPSEIVSTVRDVTEREMLQRDLALANHNLSLAEEIAHLGHWRIDLVNDTLSWSAEVFRIYGLDPTSYVPRVETAIHAYHPQDQAEVVRCVNNAIGERKSFDFRLRIIRPNGETRFVLTRGLCEIDPQTNGLTALFGVIMDVTDLAQAEREAGEKSAAKAEFMANMSHELRTPLTGMLGVFDLLGVDPVLTSKQQRLITLAGEAGRSLLAIVNDILDFSKIEAGQLVIESVPFAIRPLIDSCRTLVSETLAGKSLEFEFQSTDELPEQVIGDPTRLRQILLNLLTNAVKFTEAGKITLRAFYEQRSGRLRIEVQDTGIGISSDKINVLFERFSQADASTTRRYGGTGLGLAISKRLTELMSGVIGVRSEASKGSTFWFELPLPIFRDNTLEVQFVTDTVRTGMRLLLAEDNDINREIIAAMLLHKGFSVTTVADGEAAVAAARVPGVFDLILMDLQMPVMDGLTASTIIRGLYRSIGATQVPIIGLTANALAEDIERCLASGMDAHVAKPVHWPSLLATMNRLFNRVPLPGERPQTAVEEVLILDEAILDDLSRIIGTVRLTSLLHFFERDLRWRIDAIDVDNTMSLGEQAHSLAGLAGQLGFTALSKLCMVIQAETRENRGLHLVIELKEAIGRAVNSIQCSRFLKVI